MDIGPKNLIKIAFSLKNILWGEKTCVNIY